MSLLQDLAEETCALSLNGITETTSSCVVEFNFELLASYRWPGNVRELQNVVEGAAIISQGDSCRSMSPSENVGIALACNMSFDFTNYSQELNSAISVDNVPVGLSRATIVFNPDLAEDGLTPAVAILS